MMHTDRTPSAFVSPRSQAHRLSARVRKLEQVRDASTALLAFLDAFADVSGACPVCLCPECRAQCQRATLKMALEDSQENEPAKAGEEE